MEEIKEEVKEEVKEKVSKITKREPRVLKKDKSFSVSQILESRKYIRNRDFLKSVLDVEKTYSHKEIEQIIENFKKGSV